jgi:hypothetical protein
MKIAIVITMEGRTDEAGMAGIFKNAQAMFNTITCCDADPAVARRCIVSFDESARIVTVPSVGDMSAAEVERTWYSSDELRGFAREEFARRRSNGIQSMSTLCVESRREQEYEPDEEGVVAYGWRKDDGEAQYGGKNQLNNGRSKKDFEESGDVVYGWR